MGVAGLLQTCSVRARTHGCAASCRSFGRAVVLRADCEHACCGFAPLPFACRAPLWLYPKHQATVWSQPAFSVHVITRLRSCWALFVDVLRMRMQFPEHLGPDGEYMTADEQDRRQEADDRTYLQLLREQVHTALNRGYQGLRHRGDGRWQVQWRGGVRTAGHTASKSCRLYSSDTARHACTQALQC